MFINTNTWDMLLQFNSIWDNIFHKTVKCLTFNIYYVYCVNEMLIYEFIIPFCSIPTFWGIRVVVLKQVSCYFKCTQILFQLDDHLMKHLKPQKLQAISNQTSSAL